MRVQGAIGADRAVWQDRQHDQRHRREQQRVADFLCRQHGADEAVQLPARGQQDGDGHAQPCRQRRPLRCEAAQQHGQHQRNLGGEAGILLPPAPIGRRRKHRDAQCRRRKQRAATDQHRRGAGKRGDGKGADAGRRTPGAGALAAFAFSADQQTDAERHGEIKDRVVHGRFRFLSIFRASLECAGPGSQRFPAVTGMC